MHCVRELCWSTVYTPSGRLEHRAYVSGKVDDDICLMAIRHANIAEAAAKYTAHDNDDRSGDAVARGLLHSLSSSGLGLCLTPVGKGFSEGPAVMY